MDTQGSSWGQRTGGLASLHPSESPQLLSEEEQSRSSPFELVGSQRDLPQPTLLTILSRGSLKPCKTGARTGTERWTREGQRKGEREGRRE